MMLRLLLKEDNRYVKAFLVGKMLIWGLFLDDSIYYSKLLYDLKLQILSIILEENTHLFIKTVDFFGKCLNFVLSMLDFFIVIIFLKIPL